MMYKHVLLVTCIEQPPAYKGQFILSLNDHFNGKQTFVKHPSAIKGHFISIRVATKDRFECTCVDQ